MLTSRLQNTSLNITERQITIKIIFSLTLFDGHAPSPEAFKQVQIWFKQRVWKLSPTTPCGVYHPSVRLLSLLSLSQLRVSLPLSRKSIRRKQNKHRCQINRMWCWNYKERIQHTCCSGSSMKLDPVSLLSIFIGLTSSFMSSSVWKSQQAKTREVRGSKRPACLISKTIWLMSDWCVCSGEVKICMRVCLWYVLTLGIPICVGGK